MSASMKDRFDEIEREIMEGKHTAASVFTQMRTAAVYMAQPQPEAGPVAEREQLWAVHAQGSDDIYPAFCKEDAEKHASELNALPMPEGIAVGAVVVPSPWPAAEHWEYLAEEERDHKEQIMALAAPQPQPAVVPEGYALVPVEPTPEMVSAAEEAHMPFGDMDIALRMAILSAPSAPATVQGDEYRCRKCGEKTLPPEPYKAYVLCDCGYMTSATAAIAAAQEGGKV